MPKPSATHVSFELQPVSDAYFVDDPSSSAQRARLNLVIWRRKAAGGAPAVSEIHFLGEAQDAQQFDGLIDQLKQNLESTRAEGRSWFGPCTPIWGWK